MREIHEVDPVPNTAEEILRFGIHEIAQMAPGVHHDPNNPGYADKRKIKEYARRIELAAEHMK